MKLGQVIANREFITDLAYSIFTGKNKEYASDPDRDALGNFHKAAAEYGIHPQLVLGIFMDKHLASIRAHIAARAAGELPKSSEPFQSRIADAINYLHFLYSLEKEEITASLPPLRVQFPDVDVSGSRGELMPLHNVGADDV